MNGGFQLLGVGCSDRIDDPLGLLFGASRFPGLSLVALLDVADGVGQGHVLDEAEFGSAGVGLAAGVGGELGGGGERETVNSGRPVGLDSGGGVFPCLTPPRSDVAGFPLGGDHVGLRVGSVIAH